MKIQEISQKIKQCVVEALELDVDIEKISDDTSIFSSEDVEGLTDDSLSALEIISRISSEFDINPTEMGGEEFESIRTLSQYVQKELEKKLVQG